MRLFSSLALVAVCLATMGAPVVAAPAKPPAKPAAPAAPKPPADVLQTKPEGALLDKPRLVVALAGNLGNFLTTLANKLDDTKRFQIVNRSQHANTLKALDGRLSVEKSRALHKAVDAELALVGTAEQTAGNVRITARLFDFRTGEFTRDLSLVGEMGDAEGLATQLTEFVRSSMPLRCQITALNEDVVVLSLGDRDGVTKDSYFKVFRHPLNVKPREIGLIRILQVNAFASSGELESTVKGETLQEGDILVEQPYMNLQ